ncbi:MAG TPA: phosphopantetheine-binding protein [Actinophytocola sp.]|jgi:acyl carrier protein|uniref:phosphopantetheine-binding protein n=1 Tax=Actinophytocola sp. TaxID=1872138 RepID=UPI002F94D365
MANVTFSDIEALLVSKVGLAQQVLADNPEGTLEDLGLDSLAVLELQIVITKQYGIEIPDESGELNVGEIVDFINTANQQAA